MKTVVIDGAELGKGRGISTYLLNLCLGLGKIAAPNLSFVVVAPYRSKKFVASSNITITCKFIPFLNRVAWDLFFLPLFAKLIGADLVHYTANTGSMVLTRLLRLKKIVTVHDVSFLKSTMIVPKPESYYQLVGYYYRRINVPAALKNSDLVLTVSEFAKNDILKHGDIPSRKVFVTYNSLTDLYSETELSEEKEKIMLIVSGKSPQKNLFPTLRCLQSSGLFATGWRVVVVGVDKLVEFSEYIEFPGSMSPNELLCWYDKSSILIMPSMYESFALPIIEALSRKVLVIASDKGASAEILSGHGLLYDSSSCKDLYFAINKAIDALEKMDKNSLDAIVSYSKNFTNKNQAEITLMAYQKVLDI